MTRTFGTALYRQGGHGRRANCKYHLSLSDSDRLRLLLTISRLAFLAALGDLQAIVGGGRGLATLEIISTNLSLSVVILLVPSLFQAPASFRQSLLGAVDLQRWCWP